MTATPRRSTPSLRTSGRLVALLAVGLVTACGSEPARPSSSWYGPEPEQLVGEIQEAGQALPGELDVQPLRDPAVEDLLMQANHAVGLRRYADAAAALDKALVQSPDDPAVLQLRAEVAVLQRDLPRAAALSRRAYDLGAKVGPLCRREMMTIRQALAQRQGELVRSGSQGKLKGEKLMQWERDSAAIVLEVENIQTLQAACTLTGPPRY